MVLKKSCLFICIILFATLKFAYSQSLKLHITGEDSLETKLIDSVKYTKNHPDFNAIVNEVDGLLKKLQQLGFLEATITDISKKNDSSFTSTFALKNRYKYIRIYGVGNLNKKIIQSFIANETDDYYDIDIINLETVMKLLNNNITALGEPFASVQLIDLEPVNRKIIRGTLQTERTVKRKLDSIVIKGYEKFPRSFLRHQLKLKPNTVFNLDKIKKQTANLSNLNFASQIKEPEVLFTQDSTILYIYIEKTKVNSFDGFLGFGTNEDTNSLEFDGYLNLNLVNNLNYGETLKLFYKSDENEQRTFDLTVRMPFLFKSPLGVSANLNIFRRDSTFLSTYQTLKLDYQKDIKNRFSIGITALKSDNLLSSSSLFIEDFKTNFYIAEYNHTSPQFYDLLFPINFSVDISAGFGTRTSLNNDINQTQLKLNTSKIFNLNNRNSIFLKLEGATLVSDNYFENELFRFGGINSIRGFEENTLLANLYTVLNTEYRYRLSDILYVHSVVDAAYSENNITNAKNKLFGFGFGFGLLTNAGLFKFNYASAKTEDQPFKLADSKIHISLTAQF